MTTRFELVDEGFADPCLTTWPRHHIWSEYFHSIWSGRRGSNSLPPPWQGGALPDELRPHIGAFTLAPQGKTTRIGLEPTTPSVTGWCSNQLSYRAISGVIITTPLWSGRRGSNSLPPPWQGGALPDELRPHIRGTGVILVLLKGGASVAQSVEQGTENPRVIGSIPIGGTTSKCQPLVGQSCEARPL